MTASPVNVNPLHRNDEDETWVVAKTQVCDSIACTVISNSLLTMVYLLLVQSCFMRLRESLKRYLGDTGIPDIPDKATRRPRAWSVERYSQVLLFWLSN